MDFIDLLFKLRVWDGSLDIVYDELISLMVIILDEKGKKIIFLGELSFVGILGFEDIVIVF